MEENLWRRKIFGLGGKEEQKTIGVNNWADKWGQLLHLWLRDNFEGAVLFGAGVGAGRTHTGMARCNCTFVVSLVLTSSIAFLAAHIVRTLFFQVSKGEACNEEDLDCAGQLQNIEVRVEPFPIYYFPSVQSQAANTLKCSAFNAHCCADKRAKYVRFRKHLLNQEELLAGLQL